MLHFEVELEVAYELSSRLHYLITLFTRFCFFFYLVCNNLVCNVISTWYVIFFFFFGGGGGGGGGWVNGGY